MLALLNDIDRALNGIDWAAVKNHAGREGPWRRGVDVDITEREEDYLLEADLPGLGENDVELTVKEKVLTIRGERAVETTEQSTRRERRHLRLHRSFSLPNYVQDDAVEATLVNGVLRITIPKTPEAGPRTIPIKAA